MTNEGTWPVSFDQVAHSISVRELAILLDEWHGHCDECGLAVRLTSLNLVPPHSRYGFTGRSGARCSGIERHPAEFARTNQLLAEYGRPEDPRRRTA